MESQLPNRLLITSADSLQGCPHTATYVYSERRVGGKTDARLVEPVPDPDLSLNFVIHVRNRTTDAGAFLSASQQIAAAVLPSPEVMREHATVLGYAPDLSLVTLQEGRNGMVCTASRPGDAEFDVRCYHESFMPVVRRMRDLHSRGVKDVEIYRTINAEVRPKN